MESFFAVSSCRIAGAAGATFLRMYCRQFRFAALVALLRKCFREVLRSAVIIVIIAVVVMCEGVLKANELSFSHQ